ncbi:MAG: ATP-dependent RNA helicase HrpA [Planctomyces sp.]|nr:ATP-dependent RNA helicase HrpA [Planctomyces sp.]
MTPDRAHRGHHAPAVTVTETLSRLRSRLGECMISDRRALAGKLVALTARLRQGGGPGASAVVAAGGQGPRGGTLGEIARRAEDLAPQVERSAARAAARRGAAPAVRFDDALPVCQRRREIAEAIAGHQCVVVCGETGSGKSTQLPKICLEMGRGICGMIGHTQPRRLAARTVAGRVAEELGVPLGGPNGAVGYKVRFGDQTGPGTLIKLLTDGMLLAETQGDRLLEQYDTLIIDEAHERGLNIDFLLGYLKQLLPRRPDLKVIVTSATIDPQRLSEHFGGPSRCPVIEVSGRMYPVEVRYRPYAGSEHGPVPTGDQDEAEDRMEDRVVAAVGELAGQVEGDILVFLPGEREIRETAERLEAAGWDARHGVEVLPLMARLSADEQLRVFRPHRGRRIVLATNVAETSVTVPGVRGVVDTGLARLSRYSPRNKVQRLPVEPVSRSSAKQRAGRCGRTGPGVCVRLYSQEDHDARPEFTEPEILRTDLASVILQMAGLGLGDPRAFPFVQAPDERLIGDGYDTLVELGAIDQGQALTPIGRAMSRLPIDPRIARIVLASVEHGCVGSGLVIAAALSVQDPRERPMGAQDSADAAHARFRHEQSDFVGLLKLWRFCREKTAGVGGSRQRRFFRDNHLSFVRVREWQEVHRQLREMLEETQARLVSELADRADKPGGPPSAGQARSQGRGVGHGRSDGHGRNPAEQPGLSWLVGRSARSAVGSPEEAWDEPTPEQYEKLHRALLTGLLSSVGKKGDGYEYDGPRGMKFAIFPGSGLFGGSPRWVVAHEVVRTTRAYARTVAAIKPAWIEDAAGPLLKRSYSDPGYDQATARVLASEKTSLFGLEITSGRRVHYGPIEPTLCREVFIHHGLVEGGLEAWGVNGSFIEHNRELMERVRRLQDKLRRADLVADTTKRHAFFDARVPAGVFSGEGFERWRTEAERQRPRLLWMGEEDVIADGEESLAAIAGRLRDEFPDELALGAAEGPAEDPLESDRERAERAAAGPLAQGAAPAGGPVRVPIVYRAQPGHAEDGVTAIVPIHALASIDERAGRWLVPGMLREKIEATIRGLPKNARANLQPVAEVAERAARALVERARGAAGRGGPTQGWGAGDLSAWLADELSTLGGAQVSPAMLDAAPVPEHLQLNYRVVDGRGAVLGSGRAYHQIRRELGDQINAALRSLPEGPYNRAGIERWDVGTLPERVELTVPGSVVGLGPGSEAVRITAFPALVDAGPAEGPGARGAAAAGGVEVRPRATPQSATLVHGAGVSRLISLVAREELERAVRRLRDIDELTVLHAPLGPGALLRAGLGSAIARRAVGEPAAGVRDARGFEAVLRQGLRAFESAAAELVPAVDAALRQWHLAAAEMRRCQGTPLMAPAVADGAEHARRLMAGDFLERTPLARLADLHRYMAAARLRFEKLRRGGESLGRDERARAVVLPWQEGLDRLERTTRRHGPRWTQVQHLRWMIQELRVSLFAQELGTRVPVSVARLEKQWARIAAAAED